jgi:TonB-linked SusC/RagA family outer membrane protein
MRKFLTLLAVLVLLGPLAFSQSRVVTGKVTDQAGQPVPFATVRLKGTKLGTSADAEGNFTIRAESSQTLIISGTGVTTKEVEVGAGSVNVQVQHVTTSLSEVVVTGLGVQRQAKSLGYSTAKVSNSELVQAKPISVANGLTGKVSGLQVNTVNNGLFAPTRITLRGNRSLTGNNQPLLVVDNAIFYSDISTINPEDIADVTILKGSSAAAVYGSDASNGVIIVTTKHGNRGRPNITFSTTVQAENVSYMPAEQNRFGANGGEIFVEDFNDMSTYIPYENQSYGPEFNGKLLPLGRPAPDGTVLFAPYSPVKNQKKDFFQTGITTQNNLSFQTADDNGSFFLSLQDISSTGVMPSENGRRDIFRIGGTKKYGVFSASYGAAYTYKYTDQTNTGNVYDVLLEMPLSVPLSTLKDYTGATNYWAGPNGYFNDFYPSPYETIGTQRNHTTENDIQANVQLNLKPLKWLTLSYRSAINNISSRSEYIGSQIIYSQYALTDPRVVFSNYDGTAFDTTYNNGAKAQATGDNPHPASYTITDYSNFLYSSDFLIQANTDLSKDWTLSGTVGFSYLDNKITYTPIGVNGGSNLTFPVYNTAIYSSAPSVLGLGGTGQGTYEARKGGIFGEAVVGYQEFAFLHGSYRTDIDSRLSTANRWIPYYDIDASVVLSELFKSLANGKALNYAKIRVAHSLTGNVSPLGAGSPYIAYGAYATDPAVVAASGFPYAASGLSGYSISTTVANPNIKPEKVTEDEIGLELGFLQDRIFFTASVYKATTTDGIVYAQSSRATGATQFLVNAANTQNKGVELDLKTTVIKTRDWSWLVGINWSHIDSKVNSINGNVPSLGLSGANPNAFAVVGQPYPVVETYDWVRDSATHKVIVDGVTGLPTKSSVLTNYGSANPTDILGITTSVNWKHFKFSATADYRHGAHIFNVIGETIDHAGVGLVTASQGRQRFVFPNSVIMVNGKAVDNTDVTVNDGNFNFWPSLYNSVGGNYVVSADAWKLREVVISYNFPKSVIAPAKIIKDATLSISGRNLIMLRPSTNQTTDPEFSEDTGNDVGRTSLNQAPPTRIFSATLSITF